MYFNLSIRNVKRSFRDYLIYFLTITFGVCIFYTFNSIESQQAMLELSEVQMSIMKMLTNMISGVSVFISFILGFLIIYANRFLIRKRKKELGIYVSLGMGKGKISSLLVFETILIGLISLVTGLVLGVILSQGLSALTAKLFLVDLNKYKFVFSSSAMIKTIIYFGIMFLLVMIFNSFTITKYKLVDLLNASKKSEDLKGKNIYVSVFLFIISLTSLGIAYYLIIQNRLAATDKWFWLSIVLGIIGTFLFFRSLAGFALKLIQSNKKLYLKNLNMFTLRQINSKVNTTFISMSFICLMLFLAICILSSGLSIKNASDENIKFLTPYDATFKMDLLKNPEGGKVETVIKEMAGIDIKLYSDNYSELDVYNSDVMFKEIIKDTTDPSVKSKLEVLMDFNVQIIKVSEFNKAMKLQNENEVTLKKDDVLFLNNFKIVESSINEFLKNNSSININGENYNLNSKKTICENIETTMMEGNFLTFILPDEKVQGVTPVKRILNLNYKDDKKEQESLLQKDMTRLMNDNNSEDKLKAIDGDTRQIAIESRSGLSTTIVYLGIYLGIIFLITSGAVLAIQQLSEAADNKCRYEALNKIGVDRKMRNKSIFVQILIYFMMPLSLAVVHSIVGMYVANEVVVIFGGANSFNASLITGGVICIIYGAYFLATYNGCKNAIK
ncbi:ABC transporter permease [Clostridium gasigenes]|uniref:Putative ABC transport system permease protein n=1 Tax=Clostridium gasigenes TaxID=94869 RepID=A0A1H0LF94_9CLOT|nr:ABC transporter permease [Clostridium gasigenes]MBU3087280.1 ABC transporter permease [Clostridium gasigenes]MBU3103477.1 ABC transporter permease [Clostridium gasigenes]MBU3130907.1 ABC transporter permease [Clostridium gasigenes]SDO66746.1 putative ABC transport system permease protein [Clostridium gasigenes]